MGMFRTGGPGPKGVSAFLIDSAIPQGIVVEKRYRKARNPHQQHVSTSRSRTQRLPSDALLGAEGDGFGSAMSASTAGRIGITAQAVGILAACLDESVKFAKERMAFGKPIGAFEGMSFKIAQMAMDLDAARFLLYRAAASSPMQDVRLRSKPQSQTVRIDRRSKTRSGSAADSWRLRLHHRVSRRTSLPRCQDHRDLRRHVGNSTDHHRRSLLGKLDMNLMEYQGKELFRRSGIPVPRNGHAPTAQHVAEFLKEQPGEWVVKAQVLMGGRGRPAKSSSQPAPIRVARLRKISWRRRCRPTVRIRTANRSSRCWSKRNFRSKKKPTARLRSTALTKKPVIMVSRFGGMDIEEVSEQHPESIAKAYIDTAIGYSPFIGRELAFAAQLDPGYRKQLPAIVGSALRDVLQYGAKLVEINPLALTKEGKVVASDAKVELDDDALFRHPEFAKWQRRCRSTKTSARRERAALGIRNFLTLRRHGRHDGQRCGSGDGNDGCGRYAGGKVANFLDVGGGANAERVRKCYELVVNNTGAKVVLHQYLRRNHSRRRSRARYRARDGDDQLAQNSAGHSPDR